MTFVRETIQWNPTAFQCEDMAVEKPCQFYHVTWAEISVRHKGYLKINHSTGPPGVFFCRWIPYCREGMAAKKGYSLFASLTMLPFLPQVRWLYIFNDLLIPNPRTFVGKAWPVVVRDASRVDSHQVFDILQLFCPRYTCSQLLKPIYVSFSVLKIAINDEVLCNI